MYGHSSHMEYHIGYTYRYTQATLYGYVPFSLSSRASRRMSNYIICTAIFAILHLVLPYYINMPTYI